MSDGHKYCASVLANVVESFNTMNEDIQSVFIKVNTFLWPSFLSWSCSPN